MEENIFEKGYLTKDEFNKLVEQLYHLFQKIKKEGENVTKKAVKSFVIMTLKDSNIIIKN